MTGVPDGPPDPASPPAGADSRDLARMFDDAAPRHDLAHDLLAGGQSFRWRRLVREAVAAAPGTRVLDIFAGTGTSSVPFARSGVRTVAADFSLGMLAEGSRQYRRYGTVPRKHTAHSTGHRPSASAITRATTPTPTILAPTPLAPTTPTPTATATVPAPVATPQPAAPRPKSNRRNLAFLAADASALPFADGAFDAVTMSFGLRNVPDVRAVLRELARVTRPGGRIVVCEFSRPTNRAARAAYGVYARVVLPRIAERVASTPEAYNQLMQTVPTWPEQRDFARIMRACGWERVEWRNLSGGVVALHRATRADGPTEEA